jgi:hypothetical protein
MARPSDEELRDAHVRHNGNATAVAGELGCGRMYAASKRPPELARPNVAQCTTPHDAPGRRQKPRIRPLDVSTVAACESILERMKAHSPDYGDLPTLAIPDDPHLLEIDLFDAHFGKLAWGLECGEDYDLKIAERIYRTAVEELVRKASGYNIGRILLPFGSDMIHVDGSANETAAGTLQDVDGRFVKILNAVFAATVWAVDYLAAIAPVDIVHIPGNHDYTTSLMMAHSLWCWYRNADRVNVDCRPKPRKYYRYGTTLIGLTHGNEENPKSLPMLMANECRDKGWSETTHHEWHIGHLHKQKKTETISTDTTDGVVVRILGSLSAADAWHFRKGYVASRRVAEAYLYSFADGYTGHFNAIARD